MTSVVRFAVLVTILTAVPISEAHAGMPAITLTDVTRMRVQTISFFLLLFMLASWIVQKIWNSLSTDFPRLPRLSYRRALGLVGIWGLLFLLVLTMISGARELMTPGAWKKDGFTYKLDQPPSTLSDAQPDQSRVQTLDRLRVALWTYARSHEGLFPPDDRVPEIPEDACQTPDPSAMRYVYIGGLSPDNRPSPLCYEPDIFGGARLVLFTDGTIRRMSSDERNRSGGP